MEEFPASLAVVSASERNGSRARRPAAGLRSGAIVSVTSRFDRRKPRPAEIIERKEKVQLRAVSVDFAMCQKLGAANFHGLDSSVVIRKATSQTTLLAAGRTRQVLHRERGWRLARGPRPGLDSATALAARTYYFGPCTSSWSSPIGCPTSHLKSSIHFYFCSLQFSQPQPP